MKTTKLNIPSNSMVESYLDHIDYSDSYGICISNEDLDIREIYLEIFSFSPRWIKHLFNIRNKIVRVFGLKGPTTEELYNIDFVGNEPVHHVPYLFNSTTKPWLTQKWVRKVLENTYDVG